MHIDDDHMYHGAALIQVAEHPRFTAINSLRVNRVVVPVAYKINNEIALYLKYATKPTPAYQEYVFTFTSEQLEELARIRKDNRRTFVALVCIRLREICCLSYEELNSLINMRRDAKGEPEEQYIVIVTAPKNRELRVYVNAPGRRKSILDGKLSVPRKAFPDVVFR